MTELSAGEYDAELNGLRIHYTVRGSGPALIAHSGGPGMDARTWGDFAMIDEFVTVIALHPRGSGLSDSPEDDAYLLHDYAADLEGLRIHLGLDRPIIMGWSHGGMVAQQFAITNPNSLSKLILYDTSAYFGEFLGDIEAAVMDFEDQPWFEESLAAIKREWAGDYETDEEMAQLWEKEVKFYFNDFNSQAEAYHQRTSDLPLRIAPLKAFNEQEAETMDLRSRLYQISAPSLVMVGRHDFITNVSMAEEIVKHIPHSRLVVFEESGHLAHIEEPKKFHSKIKEFVFA